MTSVEVVLPVYNEEQVLERNLSQLHDFLQKHLPWQWTILIADNGSTDRTPLLAQALAQKYPYVKAFHLPQKGRGRALKQALLQSQADIVCYMDIDLSTDLQALPPLLQAIEEGYDIAIGSRLLPTSKVRRSLKREVISRLYNLLLRVTFGTKFKDAQCGFKALSRRAVLGLVPLVQNLNWFFDSELLILAKRKGYRIQELPVSWVESERGSKVKVIKTSLEFLRGLLRMRFQPLPRPEEKEEEDG